MLQCCLRGNCKLRVCVCVSLSILAILGCASVAAMVHYF